MSDRPVVLVTGAARGLGRDVSLAFAKKGYCVGINFSKSQKEAETLSQEISQLGSQSLFLKADIRQSKQVNQMVSTLLDKWGRVDVLINNAGNVKNKTLFSMTDEDWNDVLNVNLNGAFYCTRAVLSPMRKQKDGSIINFSSFIAGKGAKGAANYAAAKAGLITLTKNTAIEEGAFNIRANAIMPGFHVTDINHDIWTKFKEPILQQHLLGKLPDREEMANFLVTMAELKSVTGQVFAFESRLL
ncbi:MAG: SDR family NAD(P)-dependent oxidoreductase [Elusimicrobiota bacterium]